MGAWWSYFSYSKRFSTKKRCRGKGEGEGVREREREREREWKRSVTSLTRVW